MNQLDTIIDPSAIKEISKNLAKGNSLNTPPLTPPRLLLRPGETPKQDILDQTKPVEVQK